MMKTKFIVTREKLRIVTERALDAPRERVWKVYVNPALIPEWWGPKNFMTTVDKMDLKEGGVWRFVQKDPDGNTYAFNGVYKEIVPPKRLVYTFEFEPLAGHILTETVTFEEEGSRTKLTSILAYPTIGDLEGMLNSGMEKGTVESMDRFAELVEKLKK